MTVFSVGDRRGLPHVKHIVGWNKFLVSMEKGTRVLENRTCPGLDCDRGIMQFMMWIVVKKKHIELAQLQESYGS